MRDDLGCHLLRVFYKVPQLYDSAYLGNLLKQVSGQVKEYLSHDSGDNVVFVGILTNGVYVARRIKEQLQHHHDYHVKAPVMELSISLYRDDLQGQKKYLTVGTTAQTMDLSGKHVVFCDDVLSTGRTARAALNAIFDYGRPDKVSFVVLFDRENRQVPIQPNIVAERLAVSHDLRVNVGFLEVVGEDNVMLGPMESGALGG